MPSWNVTLSVCLYVLPNFAGLQSLLQRVFHASFTVKSFALAQKLMSLHKTGSIAAQNKQFYLQDVLAKSQQGAQATAISIGVLAFGSIHFYLRPRFFVMPLPAALIDVWHVISPEYACSLLLSSMLASLIAMSAKDHASHGLQPRHLLFSTGGQNLVGASPESREQQQCSPANIPAVRNLSSLDIPAFY